MRSICLIGVWLLAFPAFAQSVNVAASANGGTATASSSYSSGFPASAAIDGDRKGLNPGTGGIWTDATANAFPDWLQVNFSGVKTIGEIDVFTQQDNYPSPAEPTPTMTFTQYGLVAFEVQYWNGSAWTDVPGGNVTGNSLIWRQFTFSPISTDRIRVLVSNGGTGDYSRITELEAWSAGAYVALTAPVNNTSLPAPATVNLSATAADTTGALGKVEFYRDATLIATVPTPSSGTTSSGTYTASDTNVGAGTYSYTARAYDGANPGVTSTSAGVLVSVTTAAAGPANVAASANGGVATASSIFDNGCCSPAGTIDGDRKGLNWGNGGGWNDGTVNAFPDWLQVNFSGVKAIGEIDVFTVQDNYSSPADPTPAMTFTQYGIFAFEVQYWNGSAWADVPGGNVTSNNLVWRKFTFSPISTDRIRVLVNEAPGYSRITEVEAWTAIVNYRLGGTASSGGAPLAGVALAGTNGATCSSSDAAGQYSCTVTAGWSGSVTPSLANYHFTPASRSYSGVQADQAAQDFAGAGYTVAISGTVSSGGAPLAGVTVAGSAGATCTPSDASGQYSCTAAAGWSGSVAPLGGYAFTPASRNYSSVQADQTAQDFAGAASTVSISYIQVDHLNTPRVITDPAGNLVWTWDNTEPFGDSVPDENPSGLGIFQFDLGFPGQVRNRETGTFYNYFRDCYDPATGRYCESDPIGLRGGLNSYLYVLADPLRSMDPFGLIQIFELDGVTFHAYPGAPAGGTEHARWGEGESYHVHLKTADGQEVRYSTENWKPLTDDDAARATKAHKRAVDSLTDGEKKLLDRTNREVFHKGRPTLQQILRIGTVRGMRAGIICRPGSE